MVVAIAVTPGRVVFTTSVKMVAALVAPPQNHKTRKPLTLNPKNPETLPGVPGITPISRCSGRSGDAVASAAKAVAVEPTLEVSYVVL